MQQDLIRQLDEAVTEVFSVMLNIAFTSELDPENTVATDCQFFNASVLFTGPFEGRCCLQLDQPTAAELTSNLIGISPADLSPDLCADTAGELCNMIAGSWKKRHPQALAGCQLSCPIVTLGYRQLAPDNFREGVTMLYRCDVHTLKLRLAFNVAARL